MKHPPLDLHFNRKRKDSRRTMRMAAELQASMQAVAFPTPLADHCPGAIFNRHSTDFAPNFMEFQ